MKHQALIQISGELLLDALHLPRTTTIKAYQQDVNICGNMPLLSIVIEDPVHLKAVQEGHVLPHVCPLIETKPDRTLTFVEYVG